MEDRVDSQQSLQAAEYLDGRVCSILLPARVDHTCASPLIHSIDEYLAGKRYEGIIFDLTGVEPASDVLIAMLLAKRDRWRKETGADIALVFGDDSCMKKRLSVDMQYGTFFRLFRLYSTLEEALAAYDIGVAQESKA